MKNGIIDIHLQTFYSFHNFCAYSCFRRYAVLVDLLRELNTTHAKDRHFAFPLKDPDNPLYSLSTEDQLLQYEKEHGCRLLRIRPNPKHHGPMGGHFAYSIWDVGFVGMPGKLRDPIPIRSETRPVVLFYEMRPGKYTPGTVMQPLPLYLEKELCDIADVVQALETGAMQAGKIPENEMSYCDRFRLFIKSLPTINPLELKVVNVYYVVDDEHHYKYHNRVMLMLLHHLDFKTLVTFYERHTPLLVLNLIAVDPNSSKSMDVEVLKRILGAVSPLQPRYKVVIPSIHYTIKYQDVLDVLKDADEAFYMPGVKHLISDNSMDEAEFNEQVKQFSFRNKNEFTQKSDTVLLAPPSSTLLLGDTQE